MARALTSITQVMPARLRAEVESLHLTAIRNPWDFAAPPIDPGTVRAVGHAVPHGHLLRFDPLTPGGHRPTPHDPDFTPPLRVEPHHLVLWAGRWYLVAYRPADRPGDADPGWGIHTHGPTGVPFRRRELPGGDVVGLVRSSHDRGDTPARWQCLGSALLGLPPDVVARWAPDGSAVEYVTATRSRITLGAWSWAGIAELLATFDAELSDVEPAELRSACRTLARRCARAGEDGRGSRSGGRG